MAKGMTYTLFVPGDTSVADMMRLESTVEDIGAALTRGIPEPPKRRKPRKVNADGTPKRGPGRPRKVVDDIEEDEAPKPRLKKNIDLTPRKATPPAPVYPRKSHKSVDGDSGY